MSLGTACIDQDTNEHGRYNTISIEPADVGFLWLHGGQRSTVSTFETASVADPVVATDDRTSKYANAATSLMERNHIHHYFANAISAATESLVAIAETWLNEDSESHATEYWRRYFNVLVSSPFDTTVVGIVDALATRGNRSAIWDFMATHAVVDPTRSQRMLRDAGHRSLAAEYQAILADALERRGYEPQELYEEGLGGFVADFLREHDRVTCVVSRSAVQLLFVQNGTVRSQLFDRSAAGKIEVAEFVEVNVH